MQVLVIYYSRTGQTKKVAEELVKALQCEAEEIIDLEKRGGIAGWLQSGGEGLLKKPAKIEPAKKDPSKYDVVVIGTPIWSRNVSSPVRSYLAENKEKLKNVAFFCTEGSSGAEIAFKEMEDLCGKKAKAILAVTAPQMKDGSYAAMAKKFAGEIQA